MKLAKLKRKGALTYVAQRVTTYWPARMIGANMLASRRPRFEKPISPKAKEASASLDVDGIYMMPSFLSPERLDNIMKCIAGRTVQEVYGSRRQNLSLDAMPNDVHVAHYSAETILNAPELCEIANDPFLLEVAASYLGCKPTISSLALWWSFPTDGSAQEAENFHRDVDEWKFVKFFVYLTDVSLQSGPHAFVRKTHRSSKFLRIRRLSDQEVYSNFPKDDVLSITGKAGDAFFEDTFGLHRGTPCESQRRLVFQVQYSINPIAMYDYKPVKTSDRRNYDPYINRLYVTSGHA